MGKTVFLVLLLMSSFGLAFGITSEFEKDEPDTVSHLHLSKEEELFQLSWELTNPTENVQGYSVHWEDGASAAFVFNFADEFGQLDVPECSCGQKISITVSPYNKHGDPIGGSGRMLFICRDIVTIDSLKPEGEMIHASWSLRCPSANLTELLVMWHNEQYGYEMVCQYSGSVRDTSTKDGCHGLQHKLHQCTDYEVSIQPQSEAMGFCGLSTEKHSRTLQGKSLSTRDLKCVQLESDSATLTWRKPQCVVTDYIVSYSGEALWGEHRRDEGSIRVGEAVSEGSVVNRTVRVELLDVGSNTKSAVLNNLMPYSIYEFCVAENSTKNDARNCIVIETAEEKPEPPTLLSIDIVNRNNLNLTWNSSFNIRGKLRGYTVTWIKDTDIIGSEKISLETYTITGLELCSTYHISVTASTGAGEGEPVRKKVTLEEGCGTFNAMLIVVPIALAMVAGIIIWIKRSARLQKLFKLRNKSASMTATYQKVPNTGEDGGRVSIVNNNDENQKLSNASSEEPMIVDRNEDEATFAFRQHKMKFNQSTVFFISKRLCQDQVYDFLTVIWKNNVKIIIMLENCFQYWPVHESSGMNWNDFCVRSKDAGDTMRSYKLRTVTLEKGDERKCLKQYHFMGDLVSLIPTSSTATGELVDEVLNAMDHGPTTTILIRSLPPKKIYIPVASGKYDPDVE